MKVLLSIMITLLLVTSCATIAPPEMLEMEKVLKADLTKDQIYIRANNWAVERFNNADAVIEFSDKDAGNIAGKYVGTINNNLIDVKFKTNVRIDIKESRMKIRLSNPMVWQQSVVTNQYMWSEVKYDNSVLKKIRISWEDLIASLEESLGSKIDDNW